MEHSQGTACGPQRRALQERHFHSCRHLWCPAALKATLKFSAHVQEGWAGVHFPNTSFCTCLHTVPLHHRVREAFTGMQKERAVCTHHYSHSSNFSPRPEKSNSYIWEHQSYPEPKIFTVLLPSAPDCLAVARQLKPRPSHF